MWEYFVYFPFFILHDWVKRSAEARSSHLSGVALSLSLKLQWRDLAQWEMVYVEQSLQVMSKQER